MRKITREAADAFVNGRNFSRQNMKVSHSNGIRRMYLHSNLIAEQHASYGYLGPLRLTLAGWNTLTTRERLNGLLSVMGRDYRFSQRNFAPYYGSRQIESDEWIDIT